MYNSENLPVATPSETEVAGSPPHLPCPLLPSVALCRASCGISFLIKSSHCLVYLLVTYMMIKAPGVGTPVSLSLHCTTLGSGACSISSQQLFGDSDLCGMGVGLKFCSRTSPKLLVSVITSLFGMALGGDLEVREKQLGTPSCPLVTPLSPSFSELRGAQSYLLLNL